MNDRFAAEAAGIMIDEVTEDYARCSIRLEEIHKNARGFVMGGVLFTLADFTFAVAANGRNPENMGTTVTSEGSIYYLEPVSGEYIEATARPVRNGKTSCVYQVEMNDENGKRVALAMFSGARVAKAGK